LAHYILLALLQCSEIHAGGARSHDWRKTMTTITMTRETLRNHAQGGRTGLMGTIRTYLARTNAERQLHQLDDRLLADIGLKRHDIARAVWGK
jgi:uncharacterized protein YjiS (DUF1127 family)